MHAGHAILRFKRCKEEAHRLPDAVTRRSAPAPPCTARSSARAAVIMSSMDSPRRMAMVRCSMRVRRGSRPLTTSPHIAVDARRRPKVPDAPMGLQPGGSAVLGHGTSRTHHAGGSIAVCTGGGGGGRQRWGRPMEKNNGLTQTPPWPEVAAKAKEPQARSRARITPLSPGMEMTPGKRYVLRQDKHHSLHYIYYVSIYKIIIINFPRTTLTAK